uniref:Protein FAR1-RELATED SEQUENCE n=1 Tax=Anthurium amnicola TaxID=1678845 RepID=A0A1D1Y9B7_9ARAE
MTKTKTSSREGGCLIRRRRCPCQDVQCYIRADGEEESAVLDTGGPSETDLPGTPQAPSEIAIVEATPYVGQSFRSDDEAEEFYCNFARKDGFSIRRERSKGSQAHPLGVYKRELVCHRAGLNLPRKTADLKRQRNKKSSRCNCEAQMVIKKDVKSGLARWVVVQFSNGHNHELLDSNEVRYLPAYRNISAVDRERILALSKAGCNVNLIMRALEMEKGAKPGTLTFTERDLRNFLQSSKNLNEESEGTELLKVCKAMKDKNPDFCYEYTLDENNKLEHIAWSYGESISAYKLFGDVVVFDTTYHLYAYNRPLGVWLGVDNHGNTIFFGCVILRDETSRSFVWALQSFMHLMNGRLPQTVLTDLDLELTNAVLSEWPFTKHVFSIWHILSKLPSWFSAPLSYRYEKFKAECHRLYYLDTVEEFEHDWQQMVIEFGLITDRHINLLFSHRASWALPYLRGSFSAGLMTIGVSMSITSFFKEFLNSKTRLKDFVEQVCLAVDFQNQAAEEATIRQKYQNVKMKTCMPMEENASTILTPYAFYVLQNEIVLSVQYAVFETEKDNYLVRHHLRTDGGHIVRWLPLEEEVHCSCKQFESSGILCGHAMRVLSLKNYFFLPEKYLPIRWRLEISLFPKSRGNNYRSQALRTLATMLIQESTMTKERFSYAQAQMNRLLMYVRCMPTIDGIAFTMPMMDATADCTAVVDCMTAVDPVPNDCQPDSIVNPAQANKRRKRLKKKIVQNETSEVFEIVNGVPADIGTTNGTLTQADIEKESSMGAEMEQET